MDVVKFIQNELIVRNIKQKDFAKEIGVSESVFSDYINRDRLEIPFPSIKRAMKILCETNFTEVMDFVCGNTQKPDNMRMILEYASVTRNFPLLKKMIDSLHKEGAKEKEWAKVYDVILKFQERKTSSADLFDLVEGLKVKSLEMKILKKILTARIYYRTAEFDSMFREALRAEQLLKVLKEGYLKQTFTVRLNELLAQSYLFVNGDTEQSRKYANLVINNPSISATFKSHSYYIVGTSFLLENFDKAIDAFETYKRVLKENGREDIINSAVDGDIFFAHVFWDRDLTNVSTDDNLELAHYEAKTGNLENVNKLITDKDCPFSLCYLGIAGNDPGMLLESFFKFLGKKQKFFAGIPAEYLKRYPGYELTIKLALENINVA